jgi:hypothetical protein
VYHTTGFSKDEITELCVLVHATGVNSGGDGYPPILNLFKSVVVTLTYLRRNHVQQELAEYYGVSQSTISRAITAITPELARVMRPFTPTAEDLAVCQNSIGATTRRFSGWVRLRAGTR